MFRESMFRESLIETSHATVVQRGWATLMSFGLEMGVLSLLVLTPLFFTQVIPAFQNLPAPPAMTSISADQIRRAINVFTGADSTNAADDQVFRAPGSIPNVISLGPSRGPRGGGSPAGSCEDCVYVPGLPVGAFDPNAVFSPIFSRGPVAPVLANTDPAPKVLRRSRMSPSMLITVIEPKYPKIARIARVQGEVVLAALIDRDGRIVNLRSLRGHFMLVPAALDAVSQWRYRPTFLNGEPVAVETQIVVNFTFKDQ